MSNETMETTMTDRQADELAEELTWLDVCAVDDLPDGEMTALETDPPVAVYNVDGEFFSTANTCTHMKSALTDGYLDGDQVECVLHMATFCVRNGRATSLPATVPLRTFEVRVEEDTLQVRVPAAWVGSA
jgi:nitrite reductase/ring-hydroxylating ferredoxin subunit